MGYYFIRSNTKKNEKQKNRNKLKFKDFQSIELN